MGRATERAFDIMGVWTIRVDDLEDLDDWMGSAATMTFEGDQAIAIIRLVENVAAVAGLAHTVDDIEPAPPGHGQRLPRSLKVRAQMLLAAIARLLALLGSRTARGIDAAAILEHTTRGAA